ncbi:MAG: hypothetical protein IJA59_05225 [Clostridia bacterium]|nr:hypothetical protein [Clostridia bacterium]
MDGHENHISDACLGLPLGQALSLCEQRGITAQVIYTGERCEQKDYTARVVAVRGDTLIVSLFKDHDPRQPEDMKHE